MRRSDQKSERVEMRAGALFTHFPEAAASSASRDALLDRTSITPVWPGPTSGLCYTDRVTDAPSTSSVESETFDTEPAESVELVEPVEADAAVPEAAPDKTLTPRTRSALRRRLVRAGLVGGIVAMIVILFVVVTNMIVTRGATGLTYDHASDVPVRTVAIVFGAGVVDGKPTPALYDRVHGGVELYKQGRVSHLLMTGDNSRTDYNEVSVMREQAVNEGVPASAITRDHAGFNTYESCYRARDVFGVRDAVLVTQDYHLSRALFTCRDLGIDAVGLDIPDWQHNRELLGDGQYPAALATQYMTREWFARTKAVLAAKVTHPQPTFLGPYLGLGEA